jgi:hypothetical protein
MAGGGHVATRLGQQAVKYNLCHSYQAFNTCYTDTGLWGTYLVTDRMRIDDAMSAIQDEWYFMVLHQFVKILDGLLISFLNIRKVKSLFLVNYFLMVAVYHYMNWMHVLM